MAGNNSLTIWVGRRKCAFSFTAKNQKTGMWAAACSGRRGAARGAESAASLFGIRGGELRRAVLMKRFR